MHNFKKFKFIINMIRDKNFLDKKIKILTKNITWKTNLARIFSERQYNELI